MHPIIGITCTSIGTDSISHGIGTAYINAIEYAGAVPILLPLIQDNPCISKYLSLIDGLLLSGGVDVDPFLYGEEPIPKMGKIDVDKDRSEMLLTSGALDMGIPILGICRGIQMLNVAAGGTLYQDIYTDGTATLKHRQDAPRWYATHAINIVEGSQLAKVFGQSPIQVNTFHHQAVRNVAPKFIVSATTSDGTIEGIESTNHKFAIGVQCHPEGMWESNSTIGDLFIAFAKAAQKYMQQKQ